MKSSTFGYNSSSSLSSSGNIVTAVTVAVTVLRASTQQQQQRAAVATVPEPTGAAVSTEPAEALTAAVVPATAAIGTAATAEPQPPTALEVS